MNICQKLYSDNKNYDQLLNLFNQSITLIVNYCSSESYIHQLSFALILTFHLNHYFRFFTYFYLHVAGMLVDSTNRVHKISESIDIKCVMKKHASHCFKNCSISFRKTVQLGSLIAGSKSSSRLYTIGSLSETSSIPRKLTTLCSNPNTSSFSVSIQLTGSSCSGRSLRCFNGNRTNIKHVQTNVPLGIKY